MFDPRLDNPPESVLRFLDQRSRRDHNGEVFFADERGDPILDLDRPGVPNADARAAARWALKYRPDLWEQPKSETETAPPPPPAPTTAAEFMAAVKDGRMSAADAASGMWANSNARATVPSAQPSYAAPAAGSLTGISALMARMKAGETVPQAEIDQTFKNTMVRR